MQPDVAYQVKVVFGNKYGDIPNEFASVINVMLASSVPTVCQVQNLHKSVITDKSATLIWDPIPDANIYIVQVLH
jgi:hypothetical protein